MAGRRKLRYRYHSGPSAALRAADIVRVQDIKQISGQTDFAVLAWATTNSRILLTHDLATTIQR